MRATCKFSASFALANPYAAAGFSSFYFEQACEKENPRRFVGFYGGGRRCLLLSVSCVARAALGMTEMWVVVARVQMRVFDRRRSLVAPLHAGRMRYRISRTDLGVGATRRDISYLARHHMAFKGIPCILPCMPCSLLCHAPTPQLLSGACDAACVLQLWSHVRAPAAGEALTHKATRAGALRGSSTEGGKYTQVPASRHKPAEAHGAA